MSTSAARVAAIVSVTAGPGIADEISQTLSRRAKGGTSLATEDDRAAAAPAVSVLASRIRRLFQVPRG